MEETYEVKGGKLTVTVLAAEAETTRDWDTRVDKATEVPDINVSGEVTYRGRAYTIDQDFKRGARWHKGVNLGEGWVHNGSTYSGGHRNDLGVKVAWATATYKALDELCHEVLDLFRVDYPGWESESRAMLHRNAVSRAYGEVERLERELREATAAHASLVSKYKHDLTV